MEDKVQGRSFTSNSVKLLKHMDKLKIIQDGGRPSPVMLHISPCNPCNLTCSFCCFANRAMKEMLTVEQMKKALDSFRYLGTTGVEFTGGGEPTLHPDLDEVIRHAHDIGFKIGICTNGSRLNRIETWDKFSWVRLGMYGWDEGYTYDLSVFEGLNLDISAAYVWDGALETSTNPNITGQFSTIGRKKLSKNFQKTENFFAMLDWVEKNKIPTRIAFNAIKPVEEVRKDIATIQELIKDRELKYAFLSDFNFKGTRRNDHCYMHMVKPFLFTDGNIYVCPSAELALENNYNVNAEFKICDIDGIIEFYDNLKGGSAVSRRSHACSFCKYAYQNELIDDILIETKHNDFA